jgi:multidrug resistance efflux pump
MAKDRFKQVKGTKDFLVATVVCTFICLWAIGDAWFPTAKVLARHPQEFPITVAVSGVVQDIPVKVDEDVGGDKPLLQINPSLFEAAFAAAEEAYKTAQGSSEDVLKEKRAALLKARSELESTTVTCEDFILETSHGEGPVQGKVIKIMAEPATEVAAGSTVMLIQPKDTFYVFNQTLAVLMFIGAVISLFFHRVASK